MHKIIEEVVLHLTRFSLISKLICLSNYDHRILHDNLASMVPLALSMVVAITVSYCMVTSPRNYGDPEGPFHHTFFQSCVLQAVNYAMVC